MDPFNLISQSHFIIVLYVIIHIHFANRTYITIFAIVTRSSSNAAHSLVLTTYALAIIVRDSKYLNCLPGNKPLVVIWNAPMNVTKVVIFWSKIFSVWLILLCTMLSQSFFSAVRNRFELFEPFQGLITLNAIRNTNVAWNTVPRTMHFEKNWGTKNKFIFPFPGYLMTAVCFQLTFFIITAGIEHRCSWRIRASMNHHSSHVVCVWK